MKKNIIPGEYNYASTDITINENVEAIEVILENVGDRPIQIGSHFHLFEINSSIKVLSKDKKEDKERELVYGMRLDVASSTSVRFEPREAKKVSIIPMQGKREIFGFDNMIDGKLNDKAKVPYSKAVTLRNEKVKKNSKK